jgi:site-specific DNA recombinase
MCGGIGAFIEWNRCGYIKNPNTGKRVARPNPRDQWESANVPELRIVDEELWASVKARQERTRETMGKLLKPCSGDHNSLSDAHRPRFLLSGLLRCGRCQGSYVTVGRDRLACSTRQRKGTCDNRLTIARQEIESRVLEGLKERLLAPELVGAFIEGFLEETRRARDEAKVERAQRERQLAEIKRKIAAILRAVEDGLYDPSLKTRLAELNAERQKAEMQFGTDDPDLDVLLHPDLP